MTQQMNITEITTATGMNRSALNRYLELPENRDFFGGAHTHPLYPAASLPQFHALAEQHSRKVITPRTLAATWATRSQDADRYSETDNRNPNTDIRISDTEHQHESEQALTLSPAHVRQGAAILSEELVAALLRAGVVIGEDRLLTATQAAHYLACGPRAVKRRVPPVGPGIYRLSDIQAYIRALTPLAA